MNDHRTHGEIASRQTIPRVTGWQGMRTSECRLNSKMLARILLYVLPLVLVGCGKNKPEVKPYQFNLDIFERQLVGLSQPVERAKITNAAIILLDSLVKQTTDKVEEKRLNDLKALWESRKALLDKEMGAVLDSLKLPDDPQFAGGLDLDEMYSQQIGPTGTRFHFRIIEKRFDDRSADTYSFRLLIMRGDTVGQVQRFEADSLPLRFGVNDGYGPHVKFVDMNFDGFLDLQFSQGESVTGQDQDNLFYIFDPATYTFEYNPVVSGLFQSDFSLNEQGKEVSVGGRIGWDDVVFDIYRWQNDEFMLVAKDSHRRTDDGKGVIDKREELVNGEWKTVKEVFTPYK